MTTTAKANFDRVIECAASGKFETLTAITEHLSCDKTVASVLKSQGIICKRDGAIRLAIAIDAAKRLIPQMSEPYRKAKEVGIKPRKEFEAPQLFARENEQRNFGANMAQAAQTYTRDQVVEAFKSFYVKEYARMTDDAYRMIGFLMSALD